MKRTGNICVVIAESTLAEALAVSKGADLAEVRLDLCRFSDGEIARLFRSRGNLIATCRIGAVSESEARRRLGIALRSGARFLDLDLQSGSPMRRELSSLAGRRGCGLIISYHNFRSTPALPDLEKIIRKAKRQGAAIVKIACTMTSEADGARLLGLLDRTTPLIVTGMGRLSAVTRVAAPLLGSFLTYASIGPGKESAPGQLTARDMRKILRSFEERRR